MFRYILVLLLLSGLTGTSQAQSLDSLKQEILSLKTDVEDIKLNLATGEKRFKRGIFVATLGYSTVITGGLMLGRKRDELGKGLLVAGGAMGVVGTVLMVDSFKYLGRPAKKKRK